MAFEFTASLSGSVPANFEEMAEELRSKGLCIIEAVTPSEARFRWATSPRREHWPEDAELCHHQGGLLLTIHSGTRQQREQFVEAVAASLTKLLSEVVTFEEA